KIKPIDVLMESYGRKWADVDFMWIWSFGIVKYQSKYATYSEMDSKSKTKKLCYVCNSTGHNCRALPRSYRLDEEVPTDIDGNSINDGTDLPELEGAELEDQGGDGTALTHWEKRIFENEAMTGTHTQNSVFSRITFALMEDTGWYRANYELATPLDWGKGLGCKFSMVSCKQWLNSQSILIRCRTWLLARRPTMAAPYPWQTTVPTSKSLLGDTRVYSSEAAGVLTRRIRRSRNEYCKGGEEPLPPNLYHNDVLTCSAVNLTSPAFLLSAILILIFSLQK
ncbi:hypothetical protein HF086_009009, partial [Spodoptera exigua]